MLSLQAPWGGWLGECGALGSTISGALEEHPPGWAQGKDRRGAWGSEDHPHLQHRRSVVRSPNDSRSRGQAGYVESSRRGCRSQEVGTRSAFLGTERLKMRKPPPQSGWLSNLDGFVKTPSAALRFIFRHCSVRLYTPHSSRLARLASGAFYCAVYLGDFLRSHQNSGASENDGRCAAGA
jgi:hypothetical protein